ncbi:MAG TPA: imidazole glycerol phosphate synthase subunit HisF [Armatimonadota bacterium]|jgi:cyclase
MLAKRIIIGLDIKDGRVVKGTKFVNLRDAGDPVELAALYDAEGADEITFLDITASHERRGLIFDLARRVSEMMFIPFTVGGGITTVDDFAGIMAAGAEKVFINTSAVTTPELITQASDRFGAQAVVVAVDAKARHERDENAEAFASGYEVYIHGGRTPTGLDVVKWAQRVEELGAGELLLTSMETDGVQQGFDLGITRAVADSVGIPVIASGGGGTPQHLVDGVTEGHAEAVFIASIVHYRTYSIRECKQAMHDADIPVRLKW